MSNNDIAVEELLDECFTVYKDDLEPLSLHIFTIKAKMGKKMTLAKIKDDLVEGRGLEKYRSTLVRILDSFKSEITQYELMASFDITGLHVVLLNMFEHKSQIETLSNNKKLKRELVDILFYAERILKELDHE